MSFKNPIVLNNVSLIGSKKCFQSFSTHIYSKKHILIIGNNGEGKSSLLRILQGLTEPTSGDVSIPQGIEFGYVPQIVHTNTTLSGGQRFNKALSEALRNNPDILCLDEPTNHLDAKNKSSLIKMIKNFQGALIVVSHDPEILKLKFDEVWDIEYGSVNVFHGDYQYYINEKRVKADKLKHDRDSLKRERKKIAKKVQKEEQRAANSKSANKFENDRALLGAMRERGSSTVGVQAKRFSKVEKKIKEGLLDNFVYKPIKPKFNLQVDTIFANESILSVIDGSCGYDYPVVNDINLELKGTSKIAIVGDNGSGKSTFLKALLKKPDIQVSGVWSMPSQKHIGYLDQHYSNLNSNLTVEAVINHIVSSWDDISVQKHLNNYLFSTPEDRSKKVGVLSGGERVRLSLACIGAQTPPLLLLDEVTNNLDLQAREHVTDVLKLYPGAIIAVSHDFEFIEELSVDIVYQIEDGRFKLKV